MSAVFVTKAEFLAAQGETAEDIGRTYSAMREFTLAQTKRDQDAIKAQEERERVFLRAQVDRDKLFMEKLETLAGEQRKMVAAFETRLEGIESEQRKLKRRSRQSSHEIEERVEDAVEDITGRFHVDQQKLEIMRLTDELTRHKTESARKDSLIRFQRGWGVWAVRGAIGGGAVLIVKILEYLLSKH